MQALFIWPISWFATNAAMLIEAYGARSTFTAYVAVLRLSVAIDYAVWFAEGAFNVVAGHPGVDLLVYERVAPGAAGQPIAATIILLANYRQLTASPRYLALASWRRLGQGYGRP